MMLRIFIVASGKAYQEAAYLSAATYRKWLHPSATVTILIPRGEPVLPFLLHKGSKTIIEPFSLSLVSRRKYVSQLKCQAFLHAIKGLRPEDVALLVDADTICLRYFEVSRIISEALSQGKSCLAPDIKDRHTNDVTAPWFVLAERRVPYVNSGVIFTSKRSLDMFQKFFDLSARQSFLRGPFNDQKIINYALSHFFRDQLCLLGREFNDMAFHFAADSVIGHCAGGIEKFDTSLGRSDRHNRLCSQVLGIEQPVRNFEISSETNF